MRSRLIVACSLALALGGALGAGQNAEPSALEVLARLDTYFESYHGALGQLVADERLVQNVARGTGSGVNAIRLTREIRSEVAFVDLPGGAGWLGFRDVQRVSGKNVRAPGPSLAEVLIRSGADNYQQARALLLAGARHNLGEPRTTNLPTLPLELLQPRHRWRYDIRLEAYERVEGRRTGRVFLSSGPRRHWSGAGTVAISWRGSWDGWNPTAASCGAPKFGSRTPASSSPSGTRPPSCWCTSRRTDRTG